MKTEREYHQPVLLPEAMEFLAVQPSGVYVDATLGGGGYAEAMLQAGAIVFGFDTDPAAQEFAARRLVRFGERFQLVKENFAKLESAIGEHPVVTAHGISGMVYDLGVSSHQIDTPSIGLSYRVDAPLDMRLDPGLRISARDVIAFYDENRLQGIFRQYGEEPFSKRIARAIMHARLEAPIETTTELARIVASAVREDKKNETLSRIFQAIRIEVNGELENLQASLGQALGMINVGGRIVVIAYHSLEDRIVKEFFRRESAPEFEAGSVGSLKERIDRSKARLSVLTRKAIVPSAEEVERNPRARSAKLRAAEKI